MKPWQHAIGFLGLALLLIGSSLGLFSAPPERHMGEVSRIIYAHVPSAWNALLIPTFAFFFAMASLWTGKRKWDSRMAAATEVSVVLTILMLATGMIFARPTWGVWWDWDVRLTTSLIAMVLFLGVLILRSFLDDPRQRATWSAVAVVIAYVDVPLIYFCVRWWRSLHQIQSSPETMSELMILPMRINAFAVLFLAIWFLMMRRKIEDDRRDAAEIAPPKKLTVQTA